jgi:hypothetical protein
MLYTRLYSQAMRDIFFYMNLIYILVENINTVGGKMVRVFSKILYNLE